MICVELSCDKCSRIFGGAQTAEAVRRDAKERGWVHQAGTKELPSQYTIKGDFCPECLALVAMKKRG